MKEMMQHVYSMKNPIRNYAWGSYDGVSTYAGIAVERGKPSAEVWMGAHPDAPSLVQTPEGTWVALHKFISDFPLSMLGEEIFSEYGELPFLFKVLSASMPLSIQVHPDKEKATAGYERERAAGIPRTAPECNYRDRNHKPELAVALSSLSALCGFRDCAEACALLGPELADYFGFDVTHPQDSLRNILRKALALKEKEKLVVEERVKARARELSAGTDPTAALAGRTVLLCYEHYPHDPGAISPFFMSIIRLERGQGLFIPAGVMHAYLGGTILEIMATSDNVIRGGLTQKHMDVEDLVRVLDFEAVPLLVPPTSSENGCVETVWETPAREFALSRLDLSPSGPCRCSTEGPEILLCTQGEAKVLCSSSEYILRRGESVFIGASCPSYSVSGTAVVYRARPGSETRTRP
jgi:mannose-6-phosphate isomerase